MSVLTTSPLGILDGREKSLDTTRYAYKLQNTSNQYGIDVVFSGEPRVDESKMALWVPIADGNARDGVGDLLEVGGIDVSRHRMNPLFLFDHGKNVVLPLGIFEDRETKEYTFEIDPISKSAGGWAYFYQGKGLGGVERNAEKDHAKFCEEIFDLACERVLRGGSIGYSVIRARELQPDYEHGIPKGLHLQNVLMLEGSLVVLPANQDTVNKMLSDGKIRGKSLSETFVKSLSPYASPRKAQLGYEDRKSSVPVPLEKLPDEQIPHSKWKPGAGAIKNADVLHPEQDTYRSLETGDSSMRTKGRFEVRKGEQVLFSDDSFSRAYYWAGRNHYECIPGGMQIIDSFSGLVMSPRSELCAGLKSIRKKYKAMSAYQEGNGGALVGSDQQVKSEIPGDLNWLKEEGKETEHKSIKDLRQRYRTSAKGIRRRLKRSSPGAAVFYAHEKDLQAIQQAAEGRGLQFMYQGSGKVKLTGEDNAIDDIAKLFGRPWKQMAGKGKNMQYETKAWKDWLRALISILHISGSAMIGPVSLFGAVEEEAAYWFKRGFSPEEAAREIKNKKGTKSRQPGSDEQPEEIEHESDTWGGKSQKKSIEKPSDQKANVKEQLEPGTTPQAFVDRIADAWSTGNRGDLLAYSVRLAQSCSPLNLDIASKEKLRKLLQDREFFRAVGHIVQGLTKSHESWHQKQSRLKKLK